MKPLLEVEKLEGGYTRAPVLRRVDLTVHTDEIVGLLGANGAGKTTLLRALSGSLPNTRGEILLDGKSLVGMAPWHRAKAGLAHVPEGRHVFRAMTVRENLDAARLIGKGRFARDDVYTLFPRLAERERQAAGSLSGGEQQMLSIGRALMCGPRVLAIDEMSAGLAPIVVDQLVDGLSQLRGSGIGILLVEQSPHFVADLVDRVYLVEQGRILDEGTLQELGGANALAELYLGVG